MNIALKLYKQACDLDLQYNYCKNINISQNSNKYVMFKEYGNEVQFGWY